MKQPEINKRVKDLLGKMTLEEKVGAAASVRRFAGRSL